MVPATHRKGSSSNVTVVPSKIATLPCSSVYFRWQEVALQIQRLRGKFPAAQRLNTPKTFAGPKNFAVATVNTVELRRNPTISVVQYVPMSPRDGSAAETKKKRSIHMICIRVGITLNIMKGRRATVSQAKVRIPFVPILAEDYVWNSSQPGGECNEK